MVLGLLVLGIGEMGVVIVGCFLTGGGDRLVSLLLRYSVRIGLLRGWGWLLLSCFEGLWVGGS